MVYKKYYWKNDINLGCSAQDAGETIEMLEKRDGSITGQSFLDESRPEESPTHNCFEWDDDEAAEKYRLMQARWVINAIQVKIEREDGVELKSPAFVNVEKRRYGETAVYQTVSVAMNNQEQKKVVLTNAIAELKAFQKKYATLEELSDIFAEIDKL